jgi:hypothetical protein
MRSNNCTLFPEGSYTSCCENHDAAYGAGYDRAKADRDLRDCVIACGRPHLAWIMWAGVRAFGWVFWKKP